MKRRLVRSWTPERRCLFLNGRGGVCQVCGVIIRVSTIHGKQYGLFEIDNFIVIFCISLFELELEVNK